MDDKGAKFEPICQILHMHAAIIPILSVFTQAHPPSEVLRYKVAKYNIIAEVGPRLLVEHRKL